LSRLLSFDVLFLSCYILSLLADSVADFI